MIFRITKWFRSFRRIFSRSYWSFRLLRLKKYTQKKPETGLILIQIDGLSRPQLEKAIQQRRMRFIRRLLDQEEYAVHSIFSGVPSTTPAVQSELFYGIKQSVPAFGFRSHKNAQIKTMISNSDTRSLEESLQSRAGGLLKNGSSYSNVLTGDADAPNICTAYTGLSSLYQEAGLFRIFIVFVLHFWSLLRICALAVVELFLAITDFFRGLIHRGNFFKELSFIPSRVAISILMRELVTAGVSMDIARGVPVIHCNFLGYDEQSHRRGPDSAFAHWTLKGIDRCIRRIWRRAHRARYRNYDVWIYSDHGQEKSGSYSMVYHRSIYTVCNKILSEFGIANVQTTITPGDIQLRRAELLGQRLLSLLPFLRPRTHQTIAADIVAIGPLGHVYLNDTPTSGSTETIARALAEKGKIPLVLFKDKNSTVRAITPTADYSLPDQARLILGEHHPFLQATANDLMSLCDHPDAGDIILSGWRLGDRPLSFPFESGAHGGPGPDETHAFGVFPMDAPLPGNTNILRHSDVRSAALTLLKRKDPTPVTPLDKKNSCSSASDASSQPSNAERHADDRHIRVMTYNIHSCLGRDGRFSPERIARIIARYNPDIIGLQELDAGKARSGAIHQTRVIADILDMKFLFHPVHEIDEEQYGVSVLSRYPITLHRAASLPRIRKKEPRGALWVQFSIGAHTIDFINTHLSTSPGERNLQIQELLSETWLHALGPDRYVIFCGDFNIFPMTQSYRRILTRFNDIYHVCPESRPRATWMGLGRIDHIFASKNITVHSIHVPRNQLTRMASDHFPIVAVLEMKEDTVHSRRQKKRTAETTGRRR